MDGLFLTSYIVLWVIVICLLLLVLLLYRQFGVMLMPGRRRIELQGLDIGERPPELLVDYPRESRTSLLTWDSKSNGKTATLVIVAEPSCPICKGLLAEGRLESVPRRRRDVEFVWLDEKSPVKGPPQNWTLAVAGDGSAARLLDVPGFPFAYVLGSEGDVLAKGLINSVEEVEQLVRIARVAAKEQRRKEPGKELVTDE